MRSTLRILHLEDDRHDAELVRDTLAAHGVLADIERVDREADYIAQLEHEFDLILADYSLPSFGGSAALTIAQTRQPDTPFIFVSGTLGEDLATEALKSGATDYVLKNRLLKLPHSVRRAISEVDERVHQPIDVDAPGPRKVAGDRDISSKSELTVDVHVALPI